MSPGIPIAMIPQSQRVDLLKGELYKPRIFGLEGSEDTRLLMRVKDLAPFRNPELPIAVKLVAYQSVEETWLITVVLRVKELSQGTLVAAAYLNPRQSTDYDLLQRLSKQQFFRIIFLDEDVRESVEVSLSWSMVQREEVSGIIQNMSRSLAGPKRSAGFDPDFEAALAEFQIDYPLKDLPE